MKRYRVLPFVLPSLLLVGLIVGALLASWGNSGLAGVVPDPARRLLRLRAWLADPAAQAGWRVEAGQRCRPDAPMVMPTSGYIGFGYGDSFRPGHRHSGYDIFTPDDAVDVTPVVAAYDGYLTREADWRSAVILRHPDFPAIVPDTLIWTYYTHMASADGRQSFIAPQFPPGTHEVFVSAGTLLGYQGNWSGSPGNPTGIHLHFSIVKSTLTGGYADETDITNTYDPAPFLGVAGGADGVLGCDHHE